MFENLMFKKVELWVVALLLVSGLLGSLLLAYTVWYHFKGGEGFQNITSAALVVAKLPHAPVKTIGGLLQGSDDLIVADRFPDIKGFHFDDRFAASREFGYLLLNRYDGNIHRSVSELVDLDARQTVHRWVYDVDPIWPRSEFQSIQSNLSVDAPSERFRGMHAYLLEDGSIVTQGNRTPLLKFDFCGGIEWVQDRDIFHHSIEADNEGNIWVPSRIEPRTVSLGTDDNFSDDAITKVSPDGRILLQRSVVQILDDNGLGALVFGMGQEADQDPIHLNDIEPALTDGKFWKAGDVFLSIRNRSLVLLYRPETNKIIWHRIGPWISQHDVDILDSSRISIFSNNTKLSGVNSFSVDGVNEVFVFDFQENSVKSPFRTAFEELEIRTPTEGLAQFTARNELFAEETEFGRILHFDIEGNILWQFVNRSDDGNVYTISWSRLVPRELGNKIRRLGEEARCHD